MYASAVFTLGPSSTPAPSSATTLHAPTSSVLDRNRPLPIPPHLPPLPPPRLLNLALPMW